MSIKALFIGTILTIVILLTGQLAYILLASYIGTASTDYTFFKEYKEPLWFCLSAGTYAICFICGGLFTSILTDKRKITHAAIVGFTVAALSLLGAGDSTLLNYKAIIIVIAGLAFSALGGKIGCDPAPSELKN